MFPIAYVRKNTVYDPDAQAFITASGITSTTQKNAINNLVIGLKADSLWTPIKALYPFVGGTASTHKWNLKDPRDLDAAYRIIWNGTITHNSNGINGTGYGNTFLVPSTVLTTNSACMFLWFTTADSTSQYCGATGSGSAPYLILRGAFGTDAYANTDSFSFTLSNPSTGFVGVSRTGATTTIKIVGSTTETMTTASTSAPGVNMYVNQANGFSGSLNGSQGAYGIADGLSSAQLVNLQSRLATYQTALGR